MFLNTILFLHFRENFYNMSATALDPTFVKALRLLQSKSKVDCPVKFCLCLTCDFIFLCPPPHILENSHKLKMDL